MTTGFDIHGRQPQYARILHYANCKDSDFDLSSYVAYRLEPDGEVEIYGLDKYQTFPHYEEETDSEGNTTGNYVLSYWDTGLAYYLSDLNHLATVGGQQYWQIIVKGQLSGFQVGSSAVSADIDIQLPFYRGRCRINSGLYNSSRQYPPGRIRLRGNSSTGSDLIYYSIPYQFCEGRTIRLPDVMQLSSNMRISIRPNTNCSADISVYMPKLEHIGHQKIASQDTHDHYSYKLYAPRLTSFEYGSMQLCKSFNSDLPGHALIPDNAHLYGVHGANGIFESAFLSSLDYPGRFISDYLFYSVAPHTIGSRPLYISAENALSAGEGSFREAGDSARTTARQFYISLPQLEYAAASAFYQCRRLSSLDLPSLLSVSSDRTFAYDNALKLLHMPKAKILVTEDETVYSHGYRMLDGVSSNISIDLSQSYGIGDFFPIAVTDTIFFDNWLGYDNSSGNRATFMLSDGVQYSDGWFDRAADFQGLDTCITLTQVYPDNTAWRSWGANSAVYGFICGKATAAGYYYGGAAGKMIAKAANWGSWYHDTTNTWQSCLTSYAERLSVQFANIKSLEKMDGTDPYDGHDWRNTDMSRVSRVELGSQITSIGECAFLRCYNLTSFNDFNVAGTINNVGPSAFMYCQLPFNGPRAFHCWPSIGQRAFACDCAISSFSLDGYYDDVDVGQNAFEGCFNLEAVTHTKDAFFLDEASNFPFGCKNDNTMATVFYQYLESGGNFTYTPDTGSSDSLYNHLYIGRLIDLNPFKATTVTSEVTEASKAFTVYWGDGTSTSYPAGENFNIQHTYQIVPDNQLSVTYGSKTYYTPAYRKRRVLCITNGDGLFMETYGDGAPYLRDTSTGVGLQLQTISYGILAGLNPDGGCW